MIKVADPQTLPMGSNPYIVNNRCRWHRLELIKDSEMSLDLDELAVAEEEPMDLAELADEAHELEVALANEADRRRDPDVQRYWDRQRDIAFGISDDIAVLRRMAGR